MIDTDAELRSHIARLGEGEDEPAFHCSNCGLTSDKSDCFKPRLSDDLRCPDCGEIVEHWTPDRWVPFWFDSNAVFGMVWDRHVWDSIREAWFISGGGHTPRSIYNAKAAFRSDKVDNAPTPSFGFYGEHTGQQTLREFFKKNGMML